MADGAAVGERLDRWGKDARKEATLILVARELPVCRDAAARLSLDYLPLLRAALKAKGGRLTLADWIERAGSDQQRELAKSVEKWGLTAKFVELARDSEHAVGDRGAAREADAISSAAGLAAAVGGAQPAGAATGSTSHRGTARSVIAMNEEREGRAVRIPRLGFGAGGAAAAAAEPTAGSRRVASLPKGAVRSMVAIVTDFRALEQQYGPRALRRLTDLIRAYEEKTAGRYGEARVSLIDLGARPDLQKRPDRIKQHIDALLERDQSSALLPDVVQIVGGHAVVPHWAYRNPAHALGDPDEFLLTDNPYGEETGSGILADALLPGRIVGRFPGEAAGDSQVLEAQLAAAIEARDEPPTPGKAKRHRGVVAAAFARGDRVFEALAGGLDGLHVAPPFRDELWSEGDLNGADYLYFHVHGSDVWSEWLGDDGRGGFPVVVRPSALEGVSLERRPTVLTEACFGAYTPGRTASDSMCLALLRAGASRLFGPLNTAWTVVSDQLTLHTIDALATRPNLADALWGARIRWAEARATLSPFEQKTLLNFHVLGDAAGTLRRWAGLKRNAEEGELLDTLERLRTSIAGGRRLLPPDDGRATLRQGDRVVLARRAAEALGREGWAAGVEVEPRFVGMAARSADDPDARVYYRATRPGAHPGDERIAIVCLDRRGEDHRVFETTGSTRR
jgi:hypothetical protein